MGYENIGQFLRDMPEACHVSSANIVHGIPATSDAGVYKLAAAQRPDSRKTTGAKWQKGNLIFN